MFARLFDKYKLIIRFVLIGPLFICVCWYYLRRKFIYILLLQYPFVGILLRSLILSIQKEENNSNNSNNIQNGSLKSNQSGAAANVGGTKQSFIQLNFLSKSKSLKSTDLYTNNNKNNIPQSETREREVMLSVSSLNPGLLGVGSGSLANSPVRMNKIVPILSTGEREEQDEV